MNRNRALRFVWLSLLTLVSGLASASTVAFNPNIETRSGTTTKKEAIVLSIDSDDSQSAGNVSISTTKAPADSKTIADLHATKVGEDKVLICLNNARVVYAEDNNYILREEGRALDVLNTSLVLQQGQYVTGLVRLNVSCSAGIISTSDVVGETNSSQLEITGEVAEEPIPVFCPSVKEVADHPGDLVGLVRQQWIGAFCSESDEDYSLHYVYLSNSSDFDLKQYGSYDVTLWYNAVEDLGDPLAKAVKVEPVFTHLDAPNVTGEEMFLDSTEVTIHHDESVVVIRYTLDGTNPINTTSSVYTYTEPFVLTATATVCAVATYKDVKSDIVRKRFTKANVSEPLTVAEISALQRNIENATVKFVDAQVVYSVDNNFVVREKDGKAIDLLNTQLPLEQGKTLTGLVKLNVAYTNGVLTTSDIDGDTNTEGLTIRGEASASPLPYACNVSDVFKHPGDLLRLEQVYTSSFPAFCIYDHYYEYNGSIFISNYEEMGMLANKSYNVTFWYYDTKNGDPLVRVLEAERTLSYMPWLAISGDDVFYDTQEVTISCGRDEDIITIYYTLDGTDPISSPTTRVYDGPITLNATTTLKAYAAFKDIRSSVRTRDFVCISSDDPKSIGQLMERGKDQAGAKIKFTNAQVVYKEDLGGTYHYIVREKGKAIDLLNTMLSLDLGAMLTGTVIMDVAYDNGILKATEIEQTNVSDLDMSGSSSDYLPIATSIGFMGSYKGDLLKLEKVGIYHDAEGLQGFGDAYFLKTEYGGQSFVILSNYEEFASQLADPSGQYILTVWYNEFKNYYTFVKIVAVQKAVAAPVITTADEIFLESTSVTISAEDDASVYYTTDGSTPTPDEGTTLLYTEPFFIYQTTTIKAVAVRDGVVSAEAEITIAGPKSIAEIHTLGASLQNVLVRLNDAQVVYAEGNNYVLRENGQALDILNTSLQLKQGQYVKGYVKLDIIGNYGVYSTSDIAGETNQEMLTISGEDTENPIPMSCATLDEVNYYPGDLITVENLEWDEKWQYFYSNVDGYPIALYLSNASDFYLESGKKYDVMAWYNQSDYGSPVVKVLSVDVAISVLDVPIISGEEKFLESTMVTITHLEKEAEVKYTLDGTDPLNTTSEVYTYTEPFTLAETATVCAVATYGETTSGLATKTFAKVSLTDPLTIPELAKLKASVDNATVKLLNAKVVYTDNADGEQSYILREDDKALDILGSGLALTQGKSYTGNVKLKVTYVDGILTASDIEGETNADNLIPSGEEADDPLPIACDITQAKNYLGDLIRMSDEQVNLDGEGKSRFYKYDRHTGIEYNVYFDNATNSVLQDGKYYAATLWLNGVKEDAPSGKMIDAQPSRLDAPAINGEKVFASSVQVEIVADEAAADIYYTIDGSDPELREEQKYGGPFTLTNSATVKAIAANGTVVSSIASKAFVQFDPNGDNTIATLANVQLSVPVATVRLVNAQVVYGEGKNYVIREYINEKYYALDVMNTELPLTVGAMVSGTVRLQIDFKANQAHDNGVLVATDIAETNDKNLHIEESVNKSPRPILLDPNSFSDVYNYPGDILEVSGVNGWEFDSYRILWRGSTEVALSNGEEYAISDGVVYDNLLIWYNDVFEDKKGARAKIVGQRESFDYTLTSAGWGTIIIPFDSEKIAGVTIYECTHVNESGVLVMEERDCFKANTPYLLKGTKGEEMLCLFDGYAPYHKDSYTNGVMTGVYSEQEPPVDSYILQNHPDMAGLAFYHVTAGKGVTVSANRCYINPQSGGFKSILFPDDETNGVVNANALDSTLVDVYTTAGVKVKHQVEMGKALNDLPAGLYIINNKKIVKK